MSIAPLGQETYLPDTIDEVARVYDFLAAHEKAGRGEPAPRYFLAGPAIGEQVELPPEAYRALRQVIEAMRRNLAVTVVPQTQTLTTQQAAELLGVSRPTVVKLLDKNKIPFQRVGTHRRILLQDLLAFLVQRRSQQYAALEAMSTDMDEETDVDMVLTQLRHARGVVARLRREAAES